MSQYGRREYWDERYTRDSQPFEWYQKYTALKPLLDQAFPDKNGPILMVGCGNSRMTEDMNDDGFSQIQNIDVSAVVIDAMRKKCESRQKITWTAMDVMQLSFPDQQFSGVFDKGTMDSLLCGDNSTANVHKMLSEISRVLKPDGVFVCVSYGQPSNRMNYLEPPEFGWSVTVHTVAKPQTGVSIPSDNADVHHVYICRKGVAAPPPAESQAAPQTSA
ncbi:putative protein kinase domain protein [Paratrimastix pyriformis]|uniref:Methyltransferase type 11 domain-containing protein n=1 Tax=Paratrimastix pyriformis TaxID=342808 RepID=A0ABQ8UF84_9EUKA|nr:putative protein kinase domain protein [Paratrimastix pyriformis]